MTSFVPSLSNVKPPLTSSSIVQSLQNSAHHQQIIHQQKTQPAPTVSFSGPHLGHTTIRTVPGANIPTVAAATNQQPVAANQQSVAAAVVNAATIVTTSSSSPAGNNAASGGGNSTQFQRLKVEDALSYLDQVKFKFGNKPQVYNDFLDIMKEFKSQSIDTPGVIARVSCLFKGHPELIVGFNTFLPPGYKIEVQCSDAGTGVNVPGIISGSSMQTIVHTPHGIHTMGAGGHMSALQPPTAVVTTPIQTPQPASVRPIAIHTGNPVVAQPTTQHTGILQPSVAKITSQHSSAATIKSESLIPHQPTPPTHNYISVGSQPPAQHSATQQQPPAQPTSHLNNSSNNQPVEFNHAINYVNKIKHRFQGQPDVYKQFLEILHTYQKDQKAIKEGQPPSGRYLTEAEVYAKVSKLFQNQEDLLSEFGQFLPEATNDHSREGAALAGAAGKLNRRTGNAALGGQKHNSSVMGVPKYPSKRPQTGPLTSQMIYQQPQPPQKKQRIGVLKDVSLAEAGKYATLNEYAFFDKVRKALRNQEVYNNFLRCLVLFNQEIISRQELIQLTSTFLQKHSDLFKWFKDFVGCKGGQINIDGVTGVGAGVPTPQMPTRISGDSAMEIGNKFRNQILIYQPKIIFQMSF